MDRNLNLFIKAPERESMVYVQGRGELLLDDMILAQGFYASKASAKMANEPRRPAWIGAISSGNRIARSAPEDAVRLVPSKRLSQHAR